MTTTPSEQLADLTPEQRRLLALRLRRGRRADVPRPGSGDTASDPLSFTQEQLWFLDRLEPGNPANTIPFTIHLTGPLDASALQRALDCLIDRHEALRTVFAETDGRLLQRILPRMTVGMPRSDISGLHGADRDAALRDIEREHCVQPFALDTGPLLAVRLVALAADSHVLLASAHHIVFDAWSVGVFARDLAALYASQVYGTAADLPGLSIRPAAYAAVTRRRAERPELDRHLAYWRTRLAGAPRTSTLPTDLPRRPVQGHRGGRVQFSLPPDTAAALTRLARRTGSSRNAVLLGAFAALVYRHTGQRRVLIGMPLAGRQEPGLEHVIGSFASMIVLNVDIGPDLTAADLIRGVHAAVGEAHAHQDMPYTKVVEAAAPIRDPSANPLFQIMVSVADVVDDDLTAAGVAFRHRPVDNGHSDFDLFVSLGWQPGGLTGFIGYDADLYLRETVELTVSELVEVIAAMTAAPDTQISGLPALSRSTLTVSASFTAGPLRDGLELWIGFLRRALAVRFAPYAQIVQHLLGGEIDGPELVLLRWADWLRYADGDPDALLARGMSDLLGAIKRSSSRSAAPLLILVCPSSPDFDREPWASRFGRLDDQLARACADQATVRAVWAVDCAEHDQLDEVFDARADQVGHVPYTHDYYAALATIAARHLFGLGDKAGRPGWPHAELGPQRAAFLAEHLARADAVADRIRRSCKAAATHVQTVAAVAPRTPTEETLARLWRQALNLDEVGVTHDFFALGGHSLLATGLLSMIHREMGCGLSLYEFFTHPTIKELAELVDAAGLAGDSGPVPIGREADLIPSSAQQRLWAVAQLNDDVARHNTIYAAMLRGRLDAAALRAAIGDIVARHAILRTVFADRGGSPVMVERDSAEAWLPLVDLSAQPPQAREAGVEECIRNVAATPFDLMAGPLVRAQLVRTAADAHHLIVGMHHIVCDARSWDIFLTELSAYYQERTAGVPAQLPSLDIQFRDYAAWQARRLDGVATGEHLGFWRARLRDAPAGLAQIGDRRPARPRTDRAGRHHARWSGRLAGAAAGLARQEGVTPFSVLLTAFALVLYLRGGQDDLVIGVPHAGRGRPELEPLIGCFTDFLPLRISLTGRPTFRKLVRRTHHAVLDAYKHQDVPFAAITEALRVPRDPSRHPVFQCVFNVVEAAGESLHLPGIEVAPLDLAPTGIDFDLLLTLVRANDDLEVHFEYSAEIFSGPGASAFVDEFEAELHTALDSPDQPIKARGPAGVADRPNIPATVSLPIPVASSFDLEGVDAAVRFWAGHLGLPVTVRFCVTGQILRPLLDPDAGFGAPTGGPRIVVLRWDDPGSANAAHRLPSRLYQAEQRYEHLRQAIAVFRGWSTAPLVFLVIAGPLGHLTMRLRALCGLYADTEVIAVDEWLGRYSAASGDLPHIIGTLIARTAHRATLPSTLLLDPHSPQAHRIAHRQLRLGRAVVSTEPSGAPMHGLPIAAAVDGSQACGALLVASARNLDRLARKYPETVAFAVPDTDTARFLGHMWALDAPLPGRIAATTAIATLVESAETLRDAGAIASAVEHGYRRRTAADTADSLGEHARILARIWADVLSVRAVGVHDNLFDLGGDSLAAIRIAYHATEAGIAIIPRQVVRHPTIAELCGLIDGDTASADPGPAAGRSTSAAIPQTASAARSLEVRAADKRREDAPLTTAQRWFTDQILPGLPQPAHFNHPYYLRLLRPVSADNLRTALAHLARHHGSLRLRVRCEDGLWRQSYVPSDEALPFQSHDLSALPPADRAGHAERIAAEGQSSLDLANGPLARAIHLRLGGEPDRLLLICHHLVTDGISRGILLDDLHTLCRPLAPGERRTLPRPTTDYLDWANRLDRHARHPDVLRELPFWLEQTAMAPVPMPADLPGRVATFGMMDTEHQTLTAGETTAIRSAARRLRVTLGDLFTWAAADYLAEWTGWREVTVATTGHGREHLFPGIDLTRTTGWFQTMYPIRLALTEGAGAGAAVAAIADRLAEVPASGIGYGLLRYSCPDERVREQLASRPSPWIAVNYMGTFSFDETVEGAESFEVCAEPLGSPQDPRGRWPYPVDLAAWIVGGRLRLGSNYGTRIFRAETIRKLLRGVANRMARLGDGRSPTPAE